MPLTSATSEQEREESSAQEHPAARFGRGELQNQLLLHRISWKLDGLIHQWGAELSEETG